MSPSPIPITSPVADVPVSPSLDVDYSHLKVTAMALLALSHTPIEHRLYEVMHAETIAACRNSGSFSVRRLLGLSGLRSYGSIKRGCAGLLKKLSIENSGHDDLHRSFVYRVFSPTEIFRRRAQAGMPPYPDELDGCEGKAFGELIQHLIARTDLSRREAFVILCCVEGLTNAEIGERLRISEQTVKSHLRQIFDKFKVKRRTELVSRLLTLKSTRRSKSNGSQAGPRFPSSVN